MKKNKLFVLGMAALALTFIVGFAGCSKSGGGGRAAPASDFSYDLTADGAGIKITGYTGQGGALVIPATIEDMPVTEIGYGAFSGDSRSNNADNCDAITSVFIPDSVTVIESTAFGHIDELTKATLPNSLKIIPDSLFSYCPKLTSVNLPSGLETIGILAFNRCGELTELIIPASLTSVKFDEKFLPGNSAFAGCGKLPIKTRQTIQAWGYPGEF